MRAKRLLLTLAVGWALGLGRSLAQQSQSQPLACGQTANSSLSSAGQTNDYTFDANAGEVVTILVLGQTINAVADVYDPGGLRVGGATNNFTGPLHLAGTGTYTVRVHATDLTSTGAYGISLSFLTGQCGTPLVWGPPANGTVAKLAQVDSYTFSANAGETAVINTTSSNLTAAAYVTGPDGAIIANWVNGSTTLNFATNGTYTVGVYSFYIGTTGTYTLSLFFSKLVPSSYRLVIGTTNGAAVVTMWGEVGRSTTLRYTADLPPAGLWQTLTNFDLPWSPYQFMDWTWTNAPHRFYQTVQ